MGELDVAGLRSCAVAGFGFGVAESSFMLSQTCEFSGRHNGVVADSLLQVYDAASLGQSFPNLSKNIMPFCLQRFEVPGLWIL